MSDGAYFHSQTSHPKQTTSKLSSFTHIGRLNISNCNMYSILILFLRWRISRSHLVWGVNNIHTHNFFPYKISSPTSEQEVNFYFLYRSTKKLIFILHITMHYNQPPDHLGGPAPGLFQCINLFPAQGSPRLGTALDDSLTSSNWMEGSPPQTCWPHTDSCSPACSYPFLLPQLTFTARTTVTSPSEVFHLCWFWLE